MKETRQFFLVLVTAPNRKVARQLAESALRSRLAACANLLPTVESHYWWRGQVESARELLIIFKTVKKNLAKLEKLVLAGHPYDTPEFVVLQLTGGNERYLQWLGRAVTSSPAKSARDGAPGSSRCRS